MIHMGIIFVVNFEAGSSTGSKSSAFHTQFRLLAYSEDKEPAMYGFQKLASKP